jgi:hypothetical protein
MTPEELKSIELFYTPPSDECFEELRHVCILFYKHVIDTSFESDFQYVDEKVKYLRSLENIDCNFSSMVRGIHQNYRYIISQALSLRTRNELSMRLYGFNDDEYDPFNIWNPKNNK